MTNPRKAVRKTLQHNGSPTVKEPMVQNAVEGVGKQLYDTPWGDQGHKTRSSGAFGRGGNAGAPDRETARRKKKQGEGGDCGRVFMRGREESTTSWEKKEEKISPAKFSSGGGEREKG